MKLSFEIYLWWNRHWISVFVTVRIYTDWNANLDKFLFTFILLN